MPKWQLGRHDRASFASIQRSAKSDSVQPEGGKDVGRGIFTALPRKHVGYAENIPTECGRLWLSTAGRANAKYMAVSLLSPALRYRRRKLREKAAFIMYTHMHTRLGGNGVCQVLSTTDDTTRCCCLVRPEVCRGGERIAVGAPLQKVKAYKVGIIYVQQVHNILCSTYKIVPRMNKLLLLT